MFVIIIIMININITIVYILKYVFLNSMYLKLIAKLKNSTCEIIIINNNNNNYYYYYFFLSAFKYILFEFGKKCL